MASTTPNPDDAPVADAAGDPSRVGRLLVIVTGVLFSTGGVAIKATSMTGWQVACFRSAVAALAVVLLLPAARRGWGWRPLVVGTGYAATMVLFVLATKLTTSANAIFLQSTAPLYLVVLGPWLLDERIGRRDVAFLGALAAGMTLFFVAREPAVVTAPDPWNGNLLAVASGLSWALTVAGLRWMGRDGRPERGSTAAALVWGNVAAFLISLPFALPVAGTGRDWLVIAYLGVFQIGLAYVLLTKALRHVRALEASLLLLTEPVLNPIWTWLVHDERPAPLSLAGGGIILVATLVRTVRR